MNRLSGSGSGSSDLGITFPSEISGAQPRVQPSLRLKQFSHRTVGVTKVVGRLCALVLRVPAYRSRGLSSIPGATRF
jgi:hypothetical protein